MGVITFNGRQSTDYGFVVAHPPGYISASQIYSGLSVPGRNGQLIFSYNKTYSNVTREYEISLYNGEDTMEALAARTSEFLYSADGYARLEDTYDPLVYRQAVYVEELNVANILFYGGTAKIKFNCKPQRFLKSGETPVVFDSSGQITNPTQNDALPYIRIYGYGEVGVGSETIVVAPHGDIPYIDIDTETMNAMCQGVNCNQYITLSTTDQIVIEPGGHGISLDGNISEVDVTPRWWIL